MIEIDDTPLNEVVNSESYLRLHYLDDRYFIYNTVTLEVSVFKTPFLSSFLMKVSKQSLDYIVSPLKQQIQAIYILHQGERE